MHYDITLTVDRLCTECMHAHCNHNLLFIVLLMCCTAGLEAAAAARARTFAAPRTAALTTTTTPPATTTATADSDAADTAAASDNDESDCDSPKDVEGDAPLLRGLGPRARVKAQRQWALRRLRARALPNSANLAVLGQPAVLQALAALCAVSSSSSSTSSSSGSRGDSIAAYAARRDAAAALSVASHLPANAVRMATEPLLATISTAATTMNTSVGSAATVAAALCTLCADAGAGGEARGHAAVALGNIAHSGGGAARDILGKLGAVEALLSIVQAAVTRTQVPVITQYTLLLLLTMSVHRPVAVS
jgi:hypothetical protein